ncbi:MAG TPA: ATP-binding protein [Candidatus Krumholzibacteria bacterium]|nr:ATP-binding protein [Candidatus Krumholzibacteria bacterium]
MDAVRTSDAGTTPALAKPLRSHVNVLNGDPREFERFLVLRSIVAALIVGAGVTIVELTDELTRVAPLYVLLGISVLVGLVAFALTRLKVAVSKSAWVVVVADIALALGIMHYSGGVGGQFTTVFCLTIAAAAFLLAMPGAMTAAVMSSLCFVAYQILETHGFVDPPGRELYAQGRASGLIDAYMHTSMFLLVGTLGGYLADRIRLKGRALQHAETALEQLRVDTNYILENMSSGVLVIDSVCRVVTMNLAAEEILELRKDEVIGQHVDEALGRRVPDLAHELVQSLSIERGKRRHEIAAHSRDGRDRPLGISISLLTDAAERRRGVIAVFQDLTEVHEMRERVRKADRLAAVGELSAGIAHELRNPLASISGSIEMLHQELKLEGENGRLMELIMRESDRLDRIISDFLDFAKIRQPKRLPARLDKCLSETMVLLKKNAEKSDGISIRLECAEDVPLVYMDDEQMRQVFMNLAVNSCEAMESGGTLDVVAGPTGSGQVRIAFCDSGPGIDPEAMTRMFEPFFTNKEGGTGLGLAIANKIVVAHGGIIECRNREQGGAVFTITLPVVGATVPVAAVNGKKSKQAVTVAD